MSNKNRKVRNFNGNNNSMELTVDTSVRTYIIKNTQGRQIGELVFNPTDTDIISRYETVIDRIGEIETLIRDNPGAQGVMLVSDKIKQEIDYIINGDSTAAFFKEQSPLTTINGKFYFENVLETIAKVITREFNLEVNKTKKRMQRYTGSYMPGKI